MVVRDGKVGEGRREKCALDVVASLEQLVNRRPRGFGVLKEVVYGGDIFDHDKDATREHEDEGNNANDADGVEAEKEN